MKCANCGAEVKEGSLYCQECGKEAQVVPIYNALEDVYLQGLLDKDKKAPAKTQKGKAGKGSTKTGTKNTTNGTTKNAAAKKKTTSSSAKKANANSKTGRKKRKNNNAAIVFAILLFLCIIGAITYVGVKITIYQKNANSFDYQMYMAQDMLDRNDVSAAIEYYQKAIKLDRSRVEPKKALASIYMDRKEYDAALRTYKEILRLEPDSLLAYKGMIELYEAQDMQNKILELSKTVTNEAVLALFSDYIATPPTFGLEPGVYEKAVYLELSCAPNCKVYYSLDRKDPIKSGYLYTDRIALDSSETYEVWAICVTDKGIRSEMVTAKYTIDLPGPDEPVVTPPGSDVNYDEDTIIRVEVPDGCAAYYTWDGTDPTRLSERYENGIRILEGKNTLSVILIDEKTEKQSPIYRGIYLCYPQ